MDGSRELLLRFEAGDDQAANELFGRYYDRVVRFARRRLSARLARRLDAEDVAQSAFRSFFRRARADRIELNGTGALWRVLAAFAVAKLKGQVERNAAQRRSVARETELSHGIIESRVAEPAAGKAALLREAIENAARRLEPMERKALGEWLEGGSIEQIAKLFERSPRTIRRLPRDAERQFELELLHSSQRLRIDDRRSSQEAETLTAAIEAHSGFRSTEEGECELGFQDYRLQQHLGTGGMGKVYRAVQRQTGATVAVKSLLKSRIRDWDSVRRFLAEARLLRRLSHPNIVRYYGAGRFPNGGYFLVLDYVAGIDLGRRLAETGSLSETEAIRIIQSVAAAVGHAHQQGVLHCDLKPANVLLADDGRVYVADFGFGQYIRSSDQNDDTLGIGGTAAYMAPELLSGSREALTPAVDIYGIGALLYSMLAARSPLLRTICERCLQASPQDRYASVRDLESDLLALRSAMRSRMPLMKEPESEVE